MREIKFRAWDGKDMWTGFHLVAADIIVPLGWKKSHADVIWLQYTGLKDKNGVEIYEGDILAIDFDRYGHLPGLAERHLALRGIHGEPATVSWDTDYACFQIQNLPNRPGAVPGFQAWLGGYLVESGGKDVEVIGNIYENPGLVK